MKYDILVPTETVIAFIKIDVPVNYDEEQILNNFPFRANDWWTVTVNIDTGEIKNWPKNRKKESISLKVNDAGTYTLYGQEMQEIAKYQEYVPHGVIPGSYGDYIELDIEDGVITNWPKEPDVEVFFNKD